MSFLLCFPLKSSLFYLHLHDKLGSRSMDLYLMPDNPRPLGAVCCSCFALLLSVATVTAVSWKTVFSPPLWLIASTFPSDLLWVGNLAIQACWRIAGWSSSGAESIVNASREKGFVPSKGSVRESEADCEFIIGWVESLISIGLPCCCHQARDSYFSSPNISWLPIICQALGVQDE